MDTPSQNLSPDAETAQIAGHLIEFFKNEIKQGRLTESLRPLQAGIGTIANAVMSGLKTGPFKHLTMYSEVMQDSTFELIDAGMMDFAAATAITLSDQKSREVFEISQNTKTISCFVHNGFRTTPKSFSVLA